MTASCILKSSRSFTTTPAKIVKGIHPKRRPQIFPSVSSSVSRLHSATSDDVASMRAGEIKKELESYGISTVSFVEKSELVEALEKARAEGLKPKQSTKTTTTTTTTTSASKKNTAEKVEEKDTRPREERLAEELENCKAMKATDLKKELQELGISTKSLFEKSDFVKALAEARVDGITKSGSGSSSDEEGYAEYTDVEVLTDASSGPRQRSQSTGSSQQSRGGASPFGGGASPFGGGASPFGPSAGVGGMGGIADILKSMGMGGAASAAGSPFGGAGANPFAGMGANPFSGMGGDAMGKAQELMKNPKVMELIMKAQGNPKIMAAMQDCMSNPSAFAKYQNDPEISKFINELKKYT